MTDNINGHPKFPLGTRVISNTFFNPNIPKTVRSTEWDGVEYRYTLINFQGQLDEGYLEKDLTLYKRINIKKGLKHD